MRILTIALFLFYTTILCSQSPYTIAQLAETSLGDIDASAYLGDGRLVVVSEGAVYELTTNTQTFDVRIRLVPNGPSNVQFLTAYDRDNDGKMDIVAWGRGNVGAHYYRNSGQEINYVERWFSAVNSFNVDDMDDDGRNEIIVSGSTFKVDNDGNAERIYRNANSNDYFYKNAIFGDYDQDGDPDIVYNLNTNLGAFWTRPDSAYVPSNIDNFSHQIRWLRAVNWAGQKTLLIGKGNVVDRLEYDLATSSWTSTTISESIPNNGFDVYIQDINQDGYDDLLFYASFGRSISKIFDPASMRYEQVNLTDIGRSDALYMEIVDGQCRLNLLVGQGIVSYGYDENYQLSLLGRTTAIDFDLYASRFVDFDGDGYVDQVSHQGLKRHYYGGNDFGSIEAFDPPDALGGAYQDHDGDGDADYVVDSLWYENTGNGVFGPAQRNEEYQGYPDPRIFFVNVIHEADIDQDGDIDLLAYNRFGESLFLYTNENNQSFDGGREIATSDHISGYLRHISTLDLNGDGHLDILMAAASGMIWIEHSGGLNLGAPKTLFDGDLSPRSVDVQDGDEDGYPDIVLGTGDIVTATAYGGVHFYRGSSAGPQLSYSSQQLTGYQSFVSFIDADSSGVDDILFANSEIRIIPILSYDNIPTTSFKVIDHDQDIIVAEVNNQGREDLILYEEGTPDFKYLLHSEELASVCPQGLIELRSQEEVEAFAARYPHCDRIQGSLFIGKYNGWSDIHDLQPLFNIKEIEGDLRMSSINKVSNYNFDSLERIGGTLDYEVMKIDNFGYPNLKSIGGISIFNVFKVLGTYGFESLESLEEVRGDIKLEYGNFNEIGSLIVSDSIHGDLKISEGFGSTLEIDISPISNVRYIEGGLIIEGASSDIAYDSNTFSQIEHLDALSISTQINSPIHLNLDTDSLSYFVTNQTVVFPDNKITHVRGNLILRGAEITDWSQLNSVGASLYMTNMESIDTVSFTQLRSVGDRLLLEGSGLEDFTQFRNLKDVQRLVLSINSSNFSLHGLGAIDSLHSLNLIQNENLKTLDGLSEHLKIGYRVELSANPNLIVCDYDWLCDHIESGGNVSIGSNGIGCENASRLRCLSNSVSGLTYYDNNDNGLYDEGSDALLSNIKVGFDLGDTLLTDNNGFYQRFVAEGGEVRIGIAYDDKYVNTTSTSIEIDSFYAGVVTADELNFGLKLAEESLEPSVDAAWAHSLFLCDRVFHLEGLYTNVSSLPFDGTIEISYSDGISLDSSFTDYMSHDDVGRKVVLTLEELLPFHQRDLKIPFVAPSADFLDQPSQITIRCLSTAASGETILLDETVLDLNLLCSYDPNDKLVKTADNSGNLRYNQDNELIYTIRFQNTGNYYAEDVRIEDELADNFDLSTFRFIDASHDVEIKIVDRTVYFYFEDINLIDSTSNFEESQGFVIFAIQGNEADLGATYLNDAGIFFDFNDPIITNEVVSVVYDPLPTVEVDMTFDVLLYPQPARDKLYVISNGSPNGAYHLYNQLGQLLNTGVWQDAKAIDIRNLNTGLYVLRLSDASGEHWSSSKIIVQR